MCVSLGPSEMGLLFRSGYMETALCSLCERVRERERERETQRERRLRGLQCLYMLPVQANGPAVKAVALKSRVAKKGWCIMGTDYTTRLVLRKWYCKVMHLFMRMFLSVLEFWSSDATHSLSFPHTVALW